MGYIGQSRSVNSAVAISDYELPIALISKSVIDEFISENEEFESVKGYPVAVWKFEASRIPATSWHHTGSYYARTNHYSLDFIAQALQEEGPAIVSAYKEWKESKKKAEEDEPKRFAILTAQVWGGTKKHPKLLDPETIAGEVKGDWVIPFPETSGTKKRYSISANKTMEVIYRKTKRGAINGAKKDTK